MLELCRQRTCQLIFLGLLNYSLSIIEIGLQINRTAEADLISIFNQVVFTMVMFYLLKSEPQAQRHDPGQTGKVFEFNNLLDIS